MLIKNGWKKNERGSKRGLKGRMDGSGEWRIEWWNQGKDEDSVQMCVWLHNRRPVE